MLSHKNTPDKDLSGATVRQSTWSRFFSPDYTVGTGFYRFCPIRLADLSPYWRFTAGGDLHPALKQTFIVYSV